MKWSHYRLLISLLTALLLVRNAHCGYVPVSTDFTNIVFSDANGAVFPDFSMTPSPSSPCTLPADVSYFISELNFEASPGNLLIGAANKLYLLSNELVCLDELLWNATQSNIENCMSVNSADQTRTCQNHIRVYKQIPMTTNLVLVCGTEASVSPQCRTVDVSSGTFTAVEESVPAANAIVSYYPEFAGFGEFVRTNTTVYFGVGFYQGERGVGRDYQMAFYNVNSTVNGPLEVTSTITTRVDESWLKSPVTFVDYYRADYIPPTEQALVVSKGGGTPRPEDYHFYFVFIRENTAAAASGTEVIHSQVVRICRNDPGINGFFSTYMKARIYCMIQVPPGREFIGANDYIYNNIDSVAFNEGGRHGESESWKKTMYGAFSGPLIGPEGSAVCVYPAENSRETDPMASFNQGIFDIFREDLLTTEGVERQNGYVECNTGGRNEEESLYVDIIHDIEQMGNNPLLILEGITVTKMVVESVCVVRSSNSAQCINQDVLFLGTDDMKVMKVVFASVGAGQTTPVYSEIISLGSGDSSEEIQALHIEQVGSEKKIFVSTKSEVYQLPIERCSRFLNCSTCVGARDPYCVWNNGNNACERTTLSAVGSATGTVDSNIWQDIHDGIVPGCTNTPACSVTANALNFADFSCIIQCNSLVSFVTFSSSDNGLSISDCMDGKTLNEGRACARFSGGLGLQNYECIVTANITGGGATGPIAIFKGFTTTGVGLPALVNTTEISAVASQNSVRVCLQLRTFTDEFMNYRFSVSYGSTMSVSSTSDEVTMTTDKCLRVTGLTPGSTIYYRVNVINSEGSTSSSIRPIMLLEDVPGVIGGLTSTAVTSDSVTLSWMPPTETNGVIIGYAITVNGVEEISCVLQTDITYRVDGLLPYTQYSFTVEACTAAGEGPPAAALVVTTLCEAPGPVYNLSASSSSASELTFSWGTPILPRGDPNSLQYRVAVDCFMPGNDGSTTFITLTSYSVDSLLPRTTCCATVRARHMGSLCTNTDLGFGIDVCGQTMDATPEPVQSLTIEAVSSSTLYVTWQEPGNYARPGLTYNVAWSPGGGSGTVNQNTVFSITGLQPSTTYAVTVSAMALNGGVGGETSKSQATLSLPPTPPTDPSLTVSGNDLIFNWTAPLMSDPPVERYVARLRCNDIDFNRTVNVPTTTITFDTASAPGTTWCAAMVQAVNSIASSEFSPRISAVRPATVPTKPRCFFTGNTASNASISFTVTYPFTLTGVRVEHNVYRLNNNLARSDPQNDSQDFTIDSSNIVFVTVDRDASYDFELRFCNGGGCGPYCDHIRFNTEPTPPSPPETITSTNVGCCSADIQWSLPRNEIEGSVSYTLQITSSCSNTQEKNVFSDITAREFKFTKLCPESEYAVAIRVTELTTNTTGVYGIPYIFNTISGIPSEPRSLKPIIFDNVQGIMEMTINWGYPENPNGKITRYEIQWSPSPANTNCSDPTIKSALRGFVDGSMTEYKTSNLSNLDLANSKTVLLCVRALTSTQAGVWARFYTTNGAALGLQNGNGGDAETCSNLIIVAVIASLAVLTSIILGVVFVLVICYNGWTPLKEYKDKREEDKVEDFSKNKKPPYNKTFSIQSTSSQAPMLRNGSISS